MTTAQARPTRPARSQSQPEPETDVDDVAAGDLDFNSQVTLATGSSYPKMDDLVGCLLLIRPYADGTRPSKIAGQDDYAWVESDVWVLELPEQNGEPVWPTEFFEGERVPYSLEGFQFNGINVVPQLQRQMRKGKLSLGVLLVGEQRQRGLHEPWILDAPSQEQVDRAERFWTNLQAKQAAKNKQDYFG